MSCPRSHSLEEQRLSLNPALGYTPPRGREAFAGRRSQRGAWEAGPPASCELRSAPLSSRPPGPEARSPGPEARSPGPSRCSRPRRPQARPRPRPRRTYLRKKEAAADGPVEPPTGVPGAGVTRAAEQAPPGAHVFNMPSGPTEGGPSRTVSATATAATAASAWREGGSQ